MRLLRLFVLIVPVLGWGVACSSSAAPEGAADAGADAASSFGGSACNTCIQSSCGTERTACAGDTSCAARVSCLERCGLSPLGNIDEACAAACAAPSGNVAQAYDDCRQRASAVCVACGGSPASDAGGSAVADRILGQTCSPGTDTRACQRCSESRCCDTRQACKDNPACWTTLIDCVGACSGADAGNEYECTIACYQKDRTATQQLGELVACNVARCPAKDECGPIDPCSACLFAKCTAYTIECQSDVDCQLLSKCLLSECPEGRVDAVCRAGCEKRFPAAAILQRQEADCGSLQCAKECR